MGSKDLLAVAVAGKGRVHVTREEQLRPALWEANEVLRDHPTAAEFHVNGTIGDLANNGANGDWPSMNWGSNSWAKGAELFEAYEERSFIEPYPCCRGCFILVRPKSAGPRGPYTPSGTAGPSTSRSRASPRT